MKSKAELRKEILQLRNVLSIEERIDKSHDIAQNLIKHSAFQNADKLLLFATYKSEVETTEIFHMAKKLSKAIYYPKVLGNQMQFYQVQSEEELVEGYQGIREPEEDLSKQFQVSSKEKVLVLMPGTVFDEERNRIGYGGGYYDKYLQHLKEIMPEEHICKMALAFECQMVDIGQIKREVHDIRADYIVTENRIIF